MTDHKTPSLFQALIPVVFLIAMLSFSVGLFGSNSLDGANQITLLMAAAVATLVAYRLGYKWDDIQKGIVKSISSAMASILILLIIGSLAGTWMLSGVVPAMIYYGLKILNPTIFLFAACIICSIVSVATGSSWTTAATVGIALMGIGTTLGIPQGWIAGAILSGAYFGDKMSPLSDTTNLAPAMAGTDLFTHIRYMTITTVPSITIALIVFLIAGFAQSPEGSLDTHTAILSAMSSRFNLSGWLFIVPAVVVFMIVKKVPALPALFVGTLLGAIFALIFQPDLVREVGSQISTDGAMMGLDWPALLQFLGVMKAMFGKIAFEIGIAELDAEGLLSSSGMYGMLKTVWLILSAMVFGGVMEKAGLLKTIANTIMKMVKSTGSLILSTTGTCVFFNWTASDQYLAIVVPGRMYSKIYKEKGLAPENLSRTLEDSGTVTSVLVPWNTCGAFHSNVLGVYTWDYAIYCVFNIVSPLMTILVGYTGYKIRKLTAKPA
jgi:Na+:H+ antiporter, NhaC family